MLLSLADGYSIWRMLSLIRSACYRAAASISKKHSDETGVSRSPISCESRCNSGTGQAPPHVGIWFWFSASTKVAAHSRCLVFIQPAWWTNRVASPVTCSFCYDIYEGYWVQTTTPGWLSVVLDAIYWLLTSNPWQLTYPKVYNPFTRQFI